MRRYVFYIAIAFSAFVIGSAGVYIYVYQPRQINDLSKLSEKEFSQTIIHDSEIKHLNFTGKIKPKRDKSLTDKEKASILFAPTINRWLNKEKIAETVDPSPEIIGQITEEEFLYADYAELKQNAEKDYQTKLLDVNGDGKDELSILSNCGENENCQLWILKSKGNDFEIILSSYQDIAKFELQKNKTKGYFNIKTYEFHDDLLINSGVKSYLPTFPTLGVKIYKFDSGEYYISDCFEQYTDKNGKQKLNPLHCC